MKNSRRMFLKNAALGTIAAAAIPNIVSASVAKTGSKRIKLLKDQVILFQGDSITDAGRNKDETGFNNVRALGTGYAMLASAELLDEYASLNLKIYNKGISGNKVFQLNDRWDKDCLELKPDILSILIGVNDFWHKKNGNYDGTIDTYKKDYDALIQKTLSVLPNVKLVIGEPFGIVGVKAVDSSWLPEFSQYQAAAKELALKYGALFVPYQKIFDEAQKIAPAAYWTNDGVHTTFAGAKLMAEAWLEATGLDD